MIELNTARALVASAREDLAESSIAFLGDGCDHDNFLVDGGERGRYVLRVPKNDKVAARLAVEVGLLGELSGFPLAVPQPSGPHTAPDCDHPFSLYPYLDGVSGDDIDVDKDHAADALGRSLRYLHALEPERLQVIGLPTEIDPVEAWLGVVDRNRDTTRDVLDKIPAAALDESSLESSTREVVLHNDLWGEHALVDPGTRRITAIIDWADAAIGDPALDYAGVLAWLGPQVLTATLAAGGITASRADLARAKFFAIVSCVHSVALGRQLDKPTWASGGIAGIERALGHRL